jgi:RNA-directed DNA polymerase
MLKNICIDTQVLSKWLKAGVIDKGVFSPTSEGAPQGGIISPTLANMVLDGLESAVKRLFPSERKANAAKVNFVRYADDFVITGSSKELLEDTVKPVIKEFLAERGLSLSEEKTKVTHISDGFDFLGQNVRKYRFGKPNAKLLIKPAAKNVKAFLDKVRDVIRKYRSAKQVHLIGALNPMIRGWANYHRHIVASERFGKVDNAIWHMLLRWATRRHHNKGVRWVLNRYFGRHGERTSVFRSIEVNTRGEIRVLALRNCVDVSIQRHVKIQGDATPFDPRFETYFENRLSVKMEGDLMGRRRLLYIWKQQEGRCPVCGEKITKLTKWHLHHLIRRVDGGSDSVSNLRMLHPNCHKQHHANPRSKWKWPVESGDSA